MLEWLKGDLVAETFELLNGSVFAAQRLASGVVVRAQVDVAFAGGEHVPDGDEDGMLHGDEGFHWALRLCPVPVSGTGSRAWFSST